MLSPSSKIRAGCPNGDKSPIASGPLRPCAFLDRDGVLNRDFGYVHRKEDFQWIEGSWPALEGLALAGFWRVVITNQSGIARDFYSEQDLLDLSHWMFTQVELDLILYCPHLDDCPARKPGTGMIESAVQILPIDLSRSFFVGDKDADMECARRAGVRGLKFHESDGALDAFLLGHGVPLASR
jgi:D-glycero-D-manno-heptose 1,7-bisphosphate phosphatase